MYVYVCVCMYIKLLVRHQVVETQEKVVLMVVN